MVNALLENNDKIFWIFKKGRREVLPLKWDRVKQFNLAAPL
ncbi:hypothetical protein KKC1_21030 [Calderihabitans maritimus]|uniref:Uncharacterized protein n=1 Tax=Calderihabitans maritimus TaxID=1246530 RepID=A0A1Z5HU72_9FIRM|nr:hypothetical protein KKC1_21030 [Calderihabitans maritimus]